MAAARGKVPPLAVAAAAGLTAMGLGHAAGVGAWTVLLVLLVAVAVPVAAYRSHQLQLQRRRVTPAMVPAQQRTQTSREKGSLLPGGANTPFLMCVCPCGTKRKTAIALSPLLLQTHCGENRSSDPSGNPASSAIPHQLCRLSKGLGLSFLFFQLASALTGVLCVLCVVFALGGPWRAAASHRPNGNLDAGSLCCRTRQADTVAGLQSCLLKLPRTSFWPPRA